MKKLAILFLFIALKTIPVCAQNRYTNWLVSAQAGTTANLATNYQGALLVGFTTEVNQQVSIGPVIKGFYQNHSSQNLMGARMYSRVPLTEKLGLYIQADLLRTNTQHIYDVTIKPTAKLETSMGIELMALQNIGLTGGYNFQEYNPMSNSKAGNLNVRLIYNLPLSR